MGMMLCTIQAYALVVCHALLGFEQSYTVEEHDPYKSLA